MDSNECNVIFKEKLLEMFYFLVNFFNENNIRYYACGGTALGAIRHKGLIPWDDDIDLYVPREDYDRLSSLNDKLHEVGYNFVCFENNKDYYLPFGKIEDRNTSLQEYKDFKYITGVYVDIFPLDYYSGTKEDVALDQERYYKVFNKFQKSNSFISISDFLNLLVHAHIYSAWKWIKIYSHHPFKNMLYKNLMSEIEIARKRKGEWCVCMPQWRGKVFRTEWFENTIDVPFENTYIKVPSAYDEYLSLLYGDYMTPPPPEKRILAHDDCRYYLNLKDGLTYEEIRKRLKKGEHTVI